VTRLGTIDSVRARALECRACPLWTHATQTVFGEGPPGASIMLVGEQPGEREDEAGQPFVGPAGRVLDQALAAAQIERLCHECRQALQVSPARQAQDSPAAFRSRGGRLPVVAASRDQFGLPACDPRARVTAAHTLMGRATPIAANRGHPLEGALFSRVVVSAHPSSVLRERDHDARYAALQAISEDLRLSAQIATDERDPDAAGKPS
jgi:uracil-DNA glycosylase